MAYSNDTPIGTIVPFAGYYYLPNTTFQQMQVLQPDLTERDYSRGLQNAIELADSGWLLCDGKAYRYTTNENDILFFLCRAISYAWGGNHLSPTESSFRVPDLRGLFLRGVTLSSSSDPDASTRTKIFPTDNFGERGNQVGSFQKDELKTHHHKTIGQRKAYGALGVSDAGACPEYGTSDTDFYGGNESRPKNANVHYLIKAVHQSLNLQQLLTDNNILD